MTPVRIMRIVGPMSIGGPAVQVSTLMRDLDRDLFEQRLYVGGSGAQDVAQARPFEDQRPLPALRTLTDAMREFRPDVVHTHTAKAGTIGRIAAVLARVPVRVHTFDFTHAGTALAVRA